MGVLTTRATQCGPLANMSNGCHGGEPRNVFDYMKDFGLPDETCMLYKADDQVRGALSQSFGLKLTIQRVRH
jgi:hypothetical protein